MEAMVATPQCLTAREGTGARGNHGALQRLHLGLGLLEPEPHAHLVEQAHRCREMFGHPPIAWSPVELAEAEAAVSDEWAHAELQRQSRGGSVVGFGRRHVRVVAM